MNDTRISSLSFAEFLRASARQLRVTAESKLAAQTLNLVYLHYGTPSRIVVPSLWIWPANEDVPSDLPEDVRSALLTVKVLSSSDPKEDVLRFLDYDGGVLANLNDDTKIQYNLKRIREALESQIDVQTRINAAVQSIDARLLEIDLRGSFAEAR